MLKSFLGKAAALTAALLIAAGIFAGCNSSFDVASDAAADAEARASFISSGDRIYAVALSQPSDRLQFRLDLGSTTISKSKNNEFTFYIRNNTYCSRRYKQL